MSWTAPAFLTEFATRLEARSGLASVKVYREPVTQLDAEENIVFVRVTGDQTWAAIGNQTRDDIYMVESSILITRQGLGEDAAAQARDRAAEILAEVVDDIQELMTSAAIGTFATDIGATNLTRFNISSINLNQGANQSEQRWAQVDFDLEVTARIS